MVNVTPVDRDFVHQRANHEGDQLGRLVTGGCACNYRYLDDEVYSSKVVFSALLTRCTDCMAGHRRTGECVIPSSWMAL